MREFLKPWRMALPTLALLLLGAIWSGYWLWASSQAQARIETWRAELAEDQVQITCGKESWGGYPFRVELRCTPGSVAKDGRAIAFTELTIMAQAYDLGHILIVNDGETILSAGADETRFQHEGAIASLLVGKNGKAQFDAEFRNLAAPDFKATRLAFHTRLHTALDLAVALEGAQVTASSQKPATLDNFTLTASLNPPPQDMTFRAMAAAASVLSIGQIEMQSAAIRFTGKGEFSITDTARPEGKLKGRIENFDHVLQALADRGLLEENARMGAGAVLGLLGGNSPDGMRIELAAAQGGLYIGPFRIADLPPLF
ncbi:MAG: DUF2125 domain-containing protein [Aestuariivirgaceae bacterium]|nr:DUF2125 domain-containing protein [Aestuariivirgaceae bacterium]